MSTKKVRPNAENAMKHGAYARAVLLPHESRRDYEQLVSETRSEWCPSGPTEENLVARLIDLMWRQRRLQRHDDQLLQAHIDKIHEHNRVVPIRVELQALAPEFAEACTVEQVEKLLAKHPYGGVIPLWVPRPKESEKEASRGPQISEHLKKMEVGSLVEGPSEILTYVDPFKLGMQEDRMGRLDERILQVTKRLVQIKASKELFRHRADQAKLVSVNDKVQRAVTIDHKRGNDNNFPASSSK